MVFLQFGLFYFQASIRPCRPHNSLIAYKDDDEEPLSSFFCFKFLFTSFPIPVPILVPISVPISWFRFHGSDFVVPISRSRFRSPDFPVPISWFRFLSSDFSVPISRFRFLGSDFAVLISVTISVPNWSHMHII